MTPLSTSLTSQEGEAINTDHSNYYTNLICTYWREEERDSKPYAFLDHDVHNTDTIKFHGYAVS